MPKQWEFTSWTMLPCYSENNPLDDQFAADSKYMDTLAATQLPNTMLRPTIDLIPPDLRRVMHENGQKM
jgi:hypothetical protein